MWLWRRLTSLDLFTKFAIMAAGCIVSFSAFFAYTFSTYLRAYGEDREAELTSTYVRQAVREHIPAALFTGPATESSVAAWRKSSPFFLFGDIFRMKVYDRDGVILWSDEKRLIGRHFRDHPMLQKALRGEVVSIFEETERPEHVFERKQFRCVAEVYVPILADDKAGAILGVVEIYRHPEAFLAATQRATFLIWIVSLCGALILFASLSKIVHNAHRRQVGLQDELEANAAELASERQLLDEILNGLDAGVLVVDRDERLLWTNDTLRRWFPSLVTADQAGYLRELQTDDAQRFLRDSVQKVLRGDPRHENDCTLATPDQNRRSFHIVSSAIRDASGEIAMVVQLIQDATERRLMEGQLIQASKMAAVGEMAAKVAHEINNPIGVISGLVKVLLAHRRKLGLSEEVSGDLERVNTHADRIAHVVRTLLAFSRRGTDARKPVHMNVVVKDCISLLGKTLESSDVKLRLELTEPLPTVWGDDQQIQQVVLNLVNNSVDAMPTGGEIVISTGRRTTDEGAQRVWLRVRDTGGGIPVEVREEIFDPFFTTKSAERGTGLGLSVSRKIVREHAGTLVLESSGRDGSVLLVELPAHMPTATTGRTQADTHGRERVSGQVREEAK